MMKCIVVDDEKIILDEICAMIGQTEIEIQRSFQDPHEALENIKALNPDVVFLDIEMPGFNGVELAKKIAGFDPNIQIVFVTAYEQYALKAFEVSAVHYLLKPLTQDKIDEAVKRVLRVKQMRQDRGEVGKPEIVSGKTGPVDRISVKNMDNIIVIKISDIIFFEIGRGQDCDSNQKWQL